MLIQVFGIGCPKCVELEQTVRNIVAERSLDATVEKVTDLKEIMKAGILSTPAIALNGKLIFSGRVPSRKEVEDMLQPA